MKFLEGKFKYRGRDGYITKPAMIAIANIVHVYEGDGGGTRIELVTGKGVDLLASYSEVRAALEGATDA